MKQAHFGVIIFQLLAILFFENAINRLYYFNNSELMTCILNSIASKNQSFECMKQFGVVGIGELITGPVYYMLYGLLIGLIVVFVINAFYKISWLNGLLVVAIYLFLFFLGGLKFINEGFFTFSSQIMVRENVAGSSFILFSIYGAFGIGMLFLSIWTFKKTKKQDLA